MYKEYHCQADDFETFVREQLLFHKVISVTKVGDQIAELTLDNGVVLIAEGNEGCGGCSNGWYFLTELNSCDNAITNVEVIADGAETVFSLFVYAADNRINLLTYEGDDNGYYGVGYTLRVKEK